MNESMNRSTTTRIRMPLEFLAVLDEWAAAHQLPRSMGVRALIMRGLAWEEAKPAAAIAQQPQPLAA